MKTIFVVTCKNVPTRVFDTKNEANAWIRKMVLYGADSNWYRIYDTLYFF